MRARKLFRDPAVLGSAPRSAVAWRPDGVLIFLTIQERISLRNLAYVCRHLGATEAMALDGGSSSGLYADGHTITRPARALSNVLVVYASRQRFVQFAGRLTPSRPAATRLFAPRRPGDSPRRPGVYRRSPRPYYATRDHTPAPRFRADHH